MRVIADSAAPGCAVRKLVRHPGSSEFSAECCVHLEIPEGANVQIIVGTPALALADENRQECLAQTGGRPILKGLVVAIALVGTFLVGEHFGGRAAGTQIATVSMPQRSLAAEQHVFPDAPLPNPQSQPTSRGVPPEFQNGLHQPPTVTPPPGAATGTNPFGLEP
jgi:hypothetical protein